MSGLSGFRESPSTLVLCYCLQPRTLSLRVCTGTFCPAHHCRRFTDVTHTGPVCAPLRAGHAPVSKGLLFATAGASVLSQAARASSRHPPLLQSASHALVLRSPAELLFGCAILYYFRFIEVRHGRSHVWRMRHPFTHIDCLHGLDAPQCALSHNRSPCAPMAWRMKGNIEQRDAQARMLLGSRA